MANQSSSGAEQEDAINKPWRPIPAKRIFLRIICGKGKRQYLFFQYMLLWSVE